MKVIRGVLPTLREQKSGTIVNISSGAGLTGRAAFSLYAVGATSWGAVLPNPAVS